MLLPETGERVLLTVPALSPQEVLRVPVECPPLYAKHVLAALQYVQWVFLSPEERQAQEEKVQREEELVTRECERNLFLMELNALTSLAPRQQLQQQRLTFSQ